MRTIKFRGKSNTGVWVYGSLVQFGNEQPIIDYVKRTHPDDGRVIETDWCYVKPETVGQFTGVTDKNGKEIYEGDILHYVEEIGKNEYHYYREIVFHGGAFCQIIPLSSINAYKPLFYISLDRWDLAGNIHDNPELMEGGEKK